jgi:hypothetical protein
VPIARTQLPTAVNVPGPGPAELQDRPPTPPALPDTQIANKPAPPIPPETTPGDDETSDADGDVEGDDDEPRGRSNVTDPYSNLEGAFGNYLADEPRPMNAGGRGGRQGDDDDLLF